MEDTRRRLAAPADCRVKGVDAMRTKLPRDRRRGFTLVEVLLALAISAMLLAAIATAFNASVTNYQENQQIYETLNGARQAMLRMTAQLRTGSSVDPAAPANQCSFFTSDNQDITYAFVAGDPSSTDPEDHIGRLDLIINSTGQRCVLCRHVTAMTFIKTATAAGTDCKSVQISITVQVGDQIQTLSSAATIRRNLES